MSVPIISLLAQACQHPHPLPMHPDACYFALFYYSISTILLLCEYMVLLFHQHSLACIYTTCQCTQTRATSIATLFYSISTILLLYYHDFTTLSEHMHTTIYYFINTVLPTAPPMQPNACKPSTAVVYYTISTILLLY